MDNQKKLLQQSCDALSAWLKDESINIESVFIGGAESDWLSASEPVWDLSKYHYRIKPPPPSKWYLGQKVREKEKDVSSIITDHDEHNNNYIVRGMWCSEKTMDRDFTPIEDDK